MKINNSQEQLDNSLFINTVCTIITKEKLDMISDAKALQAFVKDKRNYFTIEQITKKAKEFDSNKAAEALLTLSATLEDLVIRGCLVKDKDCYFNTFDGMLLGTSVLSMIPGALELSYVNN